MQTWGPRGWDERRSKLKALRPGVSARKNVSDSEKMGQEEAARWVWIDISPLLTPWRMQREQEGTRSNAAEPDAPATFSGHG